MIFLLVVTVILFSYYNSAHNPSSRIYLEGVMVVLAFSMLDKKALSILALLAATSLFHWTLSGNIAWNIATISLIIYSSEKQLITADNLVFLAKGTVIILLAFVITNEINDFKIEIFKNGGPFPSSLHLSYVLVTLSLLIYIDKSPTAHIFLLCIFLMAVLNGSRASVIYSGVLLILLLVKLPLKIQVFYLLAAILIFWNFSIRAVGLELGNDDVRMSGYLNYMELVTPTNFIVGEGRANYGSIGIRVYGKENVFISESSLIMLLYCHGIFLALILLKPIFLKLYALARAAKRNIIPILLMYGLFLTVPFFDSLGIGVINAFLINQMFLNFKGTQRE